MKSRATTAGNITADCPRLRSGVAAARDAADPHVIVLYDELRISRQIVRISPREFTWLQWFDGTNSLGDVRSLAMPAESSGLDLLQALVTKLEEATFLDGPTFRQVFTGPIREPSCIGCYEGDAEALRKQLAGYLANCGTAKRPKHRKRGRLRALLAPHIDYARGHESYAWGYRDLPSHTDASLFVIVGTSHYSGERFSLTRQDFRTPLGVAPVDQPFVDRIVEHYGDGLFDDPLAHIPEHSIELEIVWLQYLFEELRPIRIVPLLVGSFHDCIQMGRDPAGVPDIARMVEALERAEAAAGEPICYVISGDLAHIGPKFGDPDPVAEPFLKRSQSMDDEILAAAERADSAAYFRVIEGEKDARRICGLPPTWTVLRAARPDTGELLHYGRYVHPKGHESVSFASMAFFA
jgi:AmmeMemoRadiSam system protein B